MITITGASTDYPIFLNLVKKGSEAATAYYNNTGSVTLTDAEYDTLIEILSQYRNHYGWSEANKLLDEVAGGVSTNNDVIHLNPMLSLEKLNSFPELITFLETFDNTNHLIVEPKLDGLALSIKYVDGKLIQVATRGGGNAGEDVTTTIPTIKNMPQTIPLMGEVEIRGEVFMTQQDYADANHIRITSEYDKWATGIEGYTRVSETQLLNDAYNKDEKTQKPYIQGRKKFLPWKHVYANPRNAAAGVLTKTKRTYDIPLSFATYDIFMNNHNGFKATYLEDVKELLSMGFFPAYTIINPTMVQKDVIEAVEEFGEVRVQKNYPYPTDGSVIKTVSYSIREVLGSRSKSPRWAVAYKYPEAPVETIIQEIQQSIGRTGRLSLRARFTPVETSGSLIEYASLHNVDWLTKKDIRVGDTVKLYKANGVIPYISRPVLEKRPTTAKKWVAPDACFQCGTSLDKATLLWRCVNPECSKLSAVVTAVGRTYLNIDGLSVRTLEKMFDNGTIEDIGDVFALTQQQIFETLQKDAVSIDAGKKNATKIYTEIQKAKQAPLSAVLASLNIRTLGRTFGKRLEKEFGTIQNVMNASYAQILAVEGIADKKADIIFVGLKEKRSLVKKMLSAGVIMQSKQVAVTKKGIFSGTKIVVSGSIPGYTRDQVEELLTSIGATMSKTVSSTTNFLIADKTASTNSKFVKAQQLGISIMSPEEFLTKIV